MPKFVSDILAKAGLTVDGVVTLNNTATGQTPDANDNSTKLATTAWVRTFVQPYSLPIASASVLGGVKVGSGLSINSSTGVLSVTGGGAASIKSTQTFTATAGQTVFTISGGYTAGLIDVFLNGVYLSPNQTTATNGTTVTLSDAALVGDIIDVIVAAPIYQGATTTTDQLPEGVVNLYYTDARSRAAISLTVTGTSGASTYDSGTGVLNIPTYTLAGLGGVPTSRTLTIDGVSYDLSANRTWNILPTGGAGGDILAKNSATNYDVAWIPNYTSQVQHTVKLAEAMTIGTPVYVSGSTGQAGTNMLVSKASNASEGTSSKTLGLIAFSGSTNDTGFVITEGLLAGLDTSAAGAAGDPVWLGPSGTLIYGLLNKPYAPAHLVFIGVVTRKQQNNGEIFVKVQNGYELEELHNLSVASPSDGDMIKYVASTGLWTKIAATTTNITEGTNLYYTQARFDTAFAAKSTTNLAEGTNLYYTDSRARAAISVTGSGSYDSATGVITVTGGVTSVNTLTGAVTLTTTNIGEGTNLYYTTARVNSDFDTRLATKSTTNLAEGTNLYYTDARVGSYLSTNSYATQSYVATQIANLVVSAPAALDTLNELAAALGNDASFSTTISTALGNRLRVDIGTQGLTSTQQGYGRTNLGLGSLATLSSIGNSYITDLAYSKLTGVPTSFTPSAHTHVWADITDRPTNLSAFTNGPGYITGYTETDTLATVTGRGATTSSSVRFGANVDISPTNSAFRFYDGTTFRGGFGLDSWGHGGSDANLVLYVNGDNTLFFSTAGTKRASLSSSAFNSSVALQQSGNQVLHAGNYSSYAFPASGGTLNGYLTVSANWGASPYTSALTIIGTYPSITFRGSNSDYEWLQHVDSAGVFHFYGGPGYTVNSWNQKLSIKTSGQLILKNHSTADSGYDNPLWIWATQDSDAIVIQNTTSGGTAPKIYFRDTNGIIQTGNTELRLRTSNSNSYSAYLSGGDWYATGSMRAPVFYDSNNTSYYLDPDSTSNVNAITMGGTLYMNGGAYYGTIIFGSSSYWRCGISQRDAGNAEMRIWAKGGGAGSIYFATGFDGEASATTLPSDGMALKNNNLGLGSWGVSEFPSYKLHVKGTGYATSDFRAPIFYDSNDTNYYLDPNGGSVLSTVRTALKAARGMNGYSGGSWVDDFTNTPISSMTFGEDKASGGPSGTWWFQVNMRHQNSSNIWGTQLAYGWEDNANRMMQRNVTGGTWSAWVEYINTANIGSQSVAYASTAGSANSVAWGNVSSRPTALSQFSNDSGYITSSGSISGNAGSANVSTYARRIDGVSRVQITVGGNASTFYPVALSTGAGSTSQQYSEFVIERGGYDDPGYTGVGFSTFNARFSYKPSGWGYEAKYWNLEQLGQTTTMLADYDDYYQASQFVVWLRGGTTYWIWAIVGGISVVFENTSGTSYNATYRTFGTTTSVAARASTSRNYYGNLRVDNNIYSGGSLISGYSIELGGSDAGNIVLSTYNNRNLRITGTGGGDVGICGRRNGGSFGFQLYGEGTAYGFLNYEWGAWNLKKVISGALYMNDNNSYYINTTGDSSFSGALSLGGSLTVSGTSTLNAQVYINRHIDANTTWGTAGVNTIFVGWSSGKVVLGNNANSGHDYANGLGANTVVSTNPFYCYQDITAYSDSRVKENVEVVDNAVEKIKAIRGVTFTRNDTEDKNKRHAGVIAQEVLAVLPEVVSEDLNGHYSVAYGNLNALLIEAIKEQQSQIESQKTEIEELKDLVKQLINR